MNHTLLLTELNAHSVPPGTKSLSTRLIKMQTVTSLHRQHSINIIHIQHQEISEEPLTKTSQTINECSSSLHITLKLDIQIDQSSSSGKQHNRWQTLSVPVSTRKQLATDAFVVQFHTENCQNSNPKTSKCRDKKTAGVIALKWIDKLNKLDEIWRWTEKKSSIICKVSRRIEDQETLLTSIVRRRLLYGLKSAPRGVNTMVEQNVPNQPPTRTDEQIVPRSQWLTIGKSNLLFNAKKIQKNPNSDISGQPE
ncbi:hypothetical protein Tco_1505706 [Tanacetum coccineum]